LNVVARNVVVGRRFPTPRPCRPVMQLTLAPSTSQPCHCLGRNALPAAEEGRIAPEVAVSRPRRLAAEMGAFTIELVLSAMRAIIVTRALYRGAWRPSRAEGAARLLPSPGRIRGRFERPVCGICCSRSTRWPIGAGVHQVLAALLARSCSQHDASYAS